jgi:hypothetical protein
MHSIRQHLAALGVPVDHLTDDEVVEGVNRVGAAVAIAGVSSEKFAAGAAALGVALAEAGGIANERG